MKKSRWRPVVITVLLVAGVVFVPPLLMRDRDPAPDAPPEIVLNPEDVDTQFAKYFPDQPWAVDLVETQSLWGWSQGGPYGWENEDGDKGGVVVADGRRRTLEVADPELTVWLLGGSTAFGFGQRDDHTIASEMVRIADERGVPIRVENLGVSGYVNWQETQVFQDLLAAGERPDVAVFLDGANDTSLGLERERFGLLDPSENHVQTMTDEQRDELTAAAEQQGYRSSNDLDVAVELAAAQYRRGVELARELGGAHDVQVVHYWQPQLYTVPLDAPLVEDALEQWQITPERHAAVGEVVDRIAERSGVEPVDLTDVFDDVDGPIFYDTSHTNEEGARLTALAIMDDLWPTILAERSDA